MQLIAGCKRPLKRKREKLIVSRNRYDPKSAQDLTKAEIDFGAAMHDYLADRRQIAWTEAEAFRVLISCGYLHPDFMACFLAFTAGVAKLKRAKRGAPAWSEVLAVAARVGMALEADAA